MVGTCYGMRGRDMGHAHLLRYQCETSDLNLKDAAQVHVIRLLMLPTGTIYSILLLFSCKLYQKWRHSNFKKTPSSVLWIYIINCSAIHYGISWRAVSNDLKATSSWVFMPEEVVSSGAPHVTVVVPRTLFLLYTILEYSIVLREAQLDVKNLEHTSQQLCNHLVCSRLCHHVDEATCCSPWTFSD